MGHIDLKEAQRSLPEVIRRVESGEDVVITREDGAAFRIVPAEKKAPVPSFGSGRGLIEVGPNFDDPIEDFAPYET